VGPDRRRSSDSGRNRIRGGQGAQDPLQATEEALRELPAEEILVPAQSDSTLAAETKFGVSVAALTS
jgi:hypothetical protein